jgi:hypothetical protein
VSHQKYDDTNQGALLESCSVWLACGYLITTGTVAVLVLGDSPRQFTVQCALREVICAALRAVPEGVSQPIRG